MFKSAAIFIVSLKCNSAAIPQSGYYFQVTEASGQQDFSGGAECSADRDAAD